MKPSKAERAAQVFVALGKSVCYLALFLGAQVLVMMPVFIAAGVQSAVGNWEMAGKLSDLVFDNAMVFSALSGLITLAVVLLFYLIRRKKLSEALWLRRVEGPGLLSGAALAPALYLAVTLMLMALPEAWLESYSEASAGISGGGVIGLIAVVLVAPVVEEFIFRGLIMTRLAGAMPGWLAVMVSAAIFGVCHGHPVWFAYAFVLGAVFGFIDLRAGSIWPSILGHVAFNAIGQVFTFIPETEEGTEVVIAMGVLLVVGIIIPILNRKAIAALFRPAPAPLAAQELSTKPKDYDYDPWDM